ncbi:interleukin-9 receptor-like isoform X1 [Tachyglossus aculeatus]|uniref:interleukin-9 receptor-like isoform X1 n=1 Tax=Tachyglossus aculeatus TaxID=9261 RepID=UPI0018F4FB51|nr:interleukin-9 receptor-like isoform X1 [Tachyglossus aculeatus]
MRTWPLQLLFWATSSVPGPQGAYLPGNLTCLNNYQYKLNCSWTSPGPTAAKDGPFRIHFIHNLLPYEFTCPVQPGPAPALLVSTCQAPNVFTSWDRFNVSLRGTNVFYLTDALYLPRLNIKPDCPTELKSNVSSRSCVISWQPPLRALAGHLSYQLDFKKIEEPWEVARRKNDIGGVTWLVLEAFEFKASGAMYQARLRCRPGQRQTSPEYAGPWSHWSRPLAFRSPIPPDPTSPPGAGEQPFPTVTFLSILLSIIILPYLVVKLSPRVKRTFYKNVPSPAGFFKPLYAVHNGNFQAWAGVSQTDSHLRREESRGAQTGATKGLLGPSPEEAISPITCSPVVPNRSPAPRKEKEEEEEDEEEEDHQASGSRELAWQCQEETYVRVEDLQGWLPEAGTPGRDLQSGTGCQPSSGGQKSPASGFPTREKGPVPLALEGFWSCRDDYCDLYCSEMPVAVLWGRPLGGSQ